MLLTSHTKWVELLERFAGAVEFGIRVFDPEREAGTVPAEGGTGTAYLKGLASKQGADERTRAQVLTALRDGVSGVVLDERWEALRTTHGVMSLAYLVHRSRANAYNQAVDNVRGSLRSLRLLSTGPWPPYSFVA